MHIRHENDSLRFFQAAPRVEIHHANPRVQGIPATGGDQEDDDGESHPDVWRSDGRNGKQSRMGRVHRGHAQPQKSVKNQDIQGIMKKGEPIPARIRKAPQQRQGQRGIGAIHLQPTESQRQEQDGQGTWMPEQGNPGPVHQPEKERQEQAHSRHPNKNRCTLSPRSHRPATPFRRDESGILFLIVS